MERLPVKGLGGPAGVIADTSTFLISRRERTLQRHSRCQLLKRLASIATGCQRSAHGASHLLGDIGFPSVGVLSRPPIHQA